MDTLANSHQLVLQLTAPQCFDYVTSIKMGQGEYDGCLAMIFRPSKPFPFDQLPSKIKLNILRFVVAPQGLLSGKVAITTKKDGFCGNGYSEGMKNRLGIMRVNKEVGSSKTMQILNADSS